MILKRACQMKTYQIEITEPAELDLREIYRYISVELQEPSIALSFIEKINEAIIGLENLPYRHELVIDEQLANQGIRKIPIEKYMIFFKIQEDEKKITVVRILYGKRDWLSLI